MSEDDFPGIVDHERKLKLLGFMLSGGTGEGILQLVQRMRSHLPEQERRGYDCTSIAGSIRGYHRVGNRRVANPLKGPTGLQYLELVKINLEKLGLVHDNIINLYVYKSCDELIALLPYKKLPPDEKNSLLYHDNNQFKFLPLLSMQSPSPPSIDKMWEREQVDQLLVYDTEEAAVNWRKVVLSPLYNQYRECSEALELLLSKKKWQVFCKQMQPDGIVSLGAGSASKDLLIIKSMLKYNDLPLTLALIDNSKSMLIHTSMEIREELKDLSLHKAISLESVLGDFMWMRPYTRIRRKGVPVVFVVAGGTIGNVNEIDLLKAIAKCSEKGDWLLIGMETTPKKIEDAEERKKFENDLMKKYDQPYSRKLLAPALERIWTKLNHKLSFNDAVKKDIKPFPVYGREGGFSMVAESMSIVFKTIGGIRPVTLLASTRYDEDAFLKFAEEFGFIRKDAAASKGNPNYRMLAFEYNDSSVASKES